MMRDIDESDLGGSVLFATAAQDLLPPQTRQMFPREQLLGKLAVFAHNLNDVADARVNWEENEIPWNIEVMGSKLPEFFVTGNAGQWVASKEAFLKAMLSPEEVFLRFVEAEGILLTESLPSAVGPKRMAIQPEATDEQDYHIGMTILQQLGGSQFCVMTGVNPKNDLVIVKTGIRVRFGPGKDGSDFLEIRLNRRTDLYDYRIGRLVGEQAEIVNECSHEQDGDGLDCEQIVTAFEEDTGLRTRMGRRV